MGNSRNRCIGVQDSHKASPPLEESPKPVLPYKSQSFSHSSHYEEGNINFLIHSKSSFLRPYSLISTENNEFSYDEGDYERKGSTDQPENFESEIQKLLSDLSSAFSSKRSQLCLNLEGKYITKKTCSDIQDFFTKAQNLVKLELNLNNVYLNDEKYSTIIAALQPHIQILELSLDISKNHLGYLSGKLTSQTVTNLLELKSLHLNLSYNPDMSGNGLEELAENLSMLKKLQGLKLDLQATKINSSDLFFLELKESLGNLPNLTQLSLDFSKNFLKSNILSLFISGLQNVVNLQKLRLNLSYNCLKPQDIYDLSSTFSEFYELCELDLVFNECGLSLSEYEVVYMGLARLMTLQKLNLDFSKNYNSNKLENFLVDYVNPERSFNTIREFRVNLAFTLFQEINYENLSFALLSMKNLIHLEICLGNNNIDAKGFENLVCALGGLKFLKFIKIDLKNCDLKGSSFETLANFLSHLKWLKQVYLGFSTNSCTFQCLLNFFEIIKSSQIEILALEVSEKKFHKDDFKLLIEKLSFFRVLKKIEFPKTPQFLSSNQKIMKVFNFFLTQKTRLIYQAFVLNNAIKDEEILKEIRRKLF